MLIRTIVILALLSVPALAQDPTLRYASFASLATAQALSSSAWQGVQCQPQPSCDPAQITTMNYPIITLVNGNSAIVIHSGDVYQGEHLSLPNPTPNILSVAFIAARATSQQISAINAYKATHPTFAANYAALVAGPIDINGPLLPPVTNELVSAGILTTNDVATIFAPKPNQSFDLTANQIAALQTRAQVGTQLPDVLPVALVGSRLTTAQTNAINTYKSSHSSFATNYAALTAGPIDLEGSLLAPVTTELQTAGILSASDVATIFAPQTTAAVKP